MVTSHLRSAHAHVRTNVLSHMRLPMDHCPLRWKTEGMKYIILALFLMTIALLCVGIMEATRPTEIEPD